MAVRPWCQLGAGPSRRAGSEHAISIPPCAPIVMICPYRQLLKDGLRALERVFLECEHGGVSLIMFRQKSSTN